MSGLWVGLALTLTLPATAELWTNQAGRVIRAELSAFDGRQVTLTRSNAPPLRLPLTALCEADQRRVRKQFGQVAVPEFVKTAYADAQAILAKYDQLPAHQKTPEVRTRAASMACAVFDGRIHVRAAELKDKEVTAEVRRLRDSLLKP